MGEDPALIHVTADHCRIRLTVGGSWVLRPFLFWGSAVWPWRELVTHTAAAHSWGKSGWGACGFTGQRREVGRVGLTSNSCSGFLATARRRHLLRVRALPALILTRAFSCGLLRPGSDQDAGVSCIFQGAVQWAPSPLAGLPASWTPWQGPWWSPLEGRLPQALCFIFCFVALVISPRLPGRDRPGLVESVSCSYQEQRSCGQHHLAGQLHVQMPVLGLCSCSGGEHAGWGQRNAKNPINDCPIGTSSWIVLRSGSASLAGSGQLRCWSRGD